MSRARQPEWCSCGRKLVRTTLNDGETGFGCPPCAMVWTQSRNPSGSHWWIWTD